MTLRQTPRRWLMTDPRFGDRLLRAIQKLPRGSGVVFRDYQLAEAERKALFESVRRVARRRGLILLVAGNEASARRWHADGFHARGGPARRSRSLLRSAPVHDAVEIAQAIRHGADLLFLSPLFATASHPGARPLGRTRFAQLAKLAKGRPVIALGGITARNGLSLDKRRVHGWAAIDAFNR